MVAGGGERARRPGRQAPGTGRPWEPASPGPQARCTRRRAGYGAGVGTGLGWVAGGPGPTVAGLAVAPVKSLRLRHPAEVRLELHGAVGDRHLFLVDRQHHLYNGVRRGRLVQIGAELVEPDGWLVLEFPDGCRVEGTTAELGARRLASVYGRRVPTRLVVGPFAAALSDFCGHELELVRPDQLGAGHDVHPVTLASTTSQLALAGRVDDPRLGDDRRFRMLMTLAGCGADEEDGWTGRLLGVGEAVLRVGGPVPRCGVTQQDPDTGQFQLPTLRHLAAHRPRGEDGRSVLFGMYAEVVIPGRVRLGDEVVPVDPAG